MFIINITYTTELEKVDELLNQHVDFLNEQYKLGYFLASGRKVPRTGGIKLSNITSRVELKKVIEKDPFKKNGVADYEFIEFTPSKTCPQLDFLIP